jgi:K+-sensing histidine kinase KdpD
VGVNSLSILQTIIQAHGGRIWIESNPDGGAIFRFALPALMEETPAIRSKPAHVASKFCAMLSRRE